MSDAPAKKNLASEPLALPAWLAPDAGREAYAPPRDRDGWLRANLLGLVGALEVFSGSSHGHCPMSRAYRHVPIALRVVGVLLLAALTSAARNMAFVWLVLAGVLVTLALRPPREIAAILRPTLVVVALSTLLVVPAALMGTPSAPARMACKSFVTTSLVLGLARSTGAHDLVAAMRSLGLPGTAALVVDLAIRDLALLGRTAAELTESLAVRSVGRNRDKSGSAAGVLGTTFLKAHDLSVAQFEAMACRGFDGDVIPAPRPALTAGGVAYLLLLAVLVAAFVALEGAMA